jgi:hypothetical protein
VTLSGVDPSDHVPAADISAAIVERAREHLGEATFADPPKLELLPFLRRIACDDRATRQD